MKHIDAEYHTRGESEYVDDVLPPSGMLHAAVFASPIAHGRIKVIDTVRAGGMPDVAAILTACDIPGDNQIGPIIPDEPLLADGGVYYVGQPIAVLLAATPDAARSAASMVRVEIEPLPAITDPREAFECGNVIGPTRTFECGNVDAAWDDCVHVVEGRCDTGGQEHVYLETQRARAVPLEGDRMRVFSSTQSPYNGQKAIARILGLPNNSVEVDVRRLGGGFGGKEDQSTSWACLAALGAWYCGEPVEIVLRRDEDMRMTGKRHPYSSDFRIGASADGRILAFSVRHYQNAGAAADLSPAVLERTLFHSTNSYFIPNVRAFGASCHTNLPPNTAFRGFGGPQGMFVIESAIARLAEVMKKRPSEIQRTNLVQDGDIFPYGQVVEDERATRTWDRAEDVYNLPTIVRDVEVFNRNSDAIKKGVAAMPVCFGISFTSTFMNQASALVHVYTDGSVSVTTGGVEMGQGLSTNIARIASRAFGIGAHRIHIESTNTTRIANMSPSAASSTTVLNGNATLLAVEQIKNRLLAVARSELDAPSTAELSISDERVLCEGKETHFTWEDLVSRAYFQRVALSAHGHFATPGIHFDKSSEKGRPFAYHTYGTAIVEVTLDCLRGTYEVDAVKIVHDLGRPLNRLVDLGQVEGGLAQGLGWMTMEDLRYDELGRLESSALATYKVPDVYFMPDDLRVAFLEDADEPLGPFGNKAVGEPPFMYGIGVFFALREAMRAFRSDLDFEFRSPLTPERILVELYPEQVEAFETATYSGPGQQ